MNSLFYQQFYDRIGKLNGWDFSRVQMSTEGERWDFQKEVTSRAEASDWLLDIGTGGGENALSLASYVQVLIGIDMASGMIETARQRQFESQITNARFALMEADRLQFPDQLFDIVTCRHSEFNALETARVLKKNGWFITQQVSEHDKWNVKEAFGRGQAYDKPNGTLLKQYVAALEQAEFTDIQVLEYDAAVYFKTSDDLLFLLSHTPIVPDFGHAEGDMERFELFVEANRTEKGIRTNATRFLIVARH